MSTPLPGKPRENHVVNPRLPLSGNRRASLRKERNDDKMPTGFTGEFNNLTPGIDNAGTK
jgi:hypothetical protein